MDYLGWVFAGLCAAIAWLSVSNIRMRWTRQRELSALWLQRWIADLLADRRPSNCPTKVDATVNQRGALLMLAAYMRNEEYFSQFLRVSTLSDSYMLSLVEAIVKPDFNLVRRWLLLSGLQDQTANRSLATPVCPCSNPCLSGHRLVMQLLEKPKFQHTVPVMKKMADLYDGNGYYLAQLIEEKLVSMDEIRAYKPTLPQDLAVLAGPTSAASTSK